MLASTWAFVVIEVLSLLLFAIVVMQYMRVVSKHRLLPASIRHTLEREPEKGTTALLMLYVIITIALTIGLALLFWFQPHLY